MHPGVILILATEVRKAILLQNGKLKTSWYGFVIHGWSFIIYFLILTLTKYLITPHSRSMTRMETISMKISCQETGAGDKPYVLSI